MSIRAVDPTCLRCGKPLTASRLPFVGDDCAERYTAEQLAELAAYAEQLADPFHIPDDLRSLTAEGRRNNRNARAAAAAPHLGQLCRHDGIIGRCGACRREADPDRAAERVLREICGLPNSDRRAERIAVQTARRARGIPAPARRPRPRPQPATAQMELL